MAAGNAIPAGEIYARAGIVSLFIPKSLRLAGELRRVYCRVIQHTRAGYQLNTKWGLITGRHQHSQLNGVDSDIEDISRLTIQQANQEPKLSFAKIVELMNSRGPIRAQQRAGRRGKRTRQEQEGDGDESGGAGTEDVIAVEQPLARR